MLLKFREDHPKLKTILLADALHATVPLLEMLLKLEIGFVPVFLVFATSFLT
jgi:hypothetical protein